MTEEEVCESNARSVQAYREEEIDRMQHEVSTSISYLRRNLLRYHNLMPPEARHLSRTVTKLDELEEIWKFRITKELD